ncbi:helix-turn-helix domain-containing protein [Nonomuraea purpurea]|uniref:Helix-turn-helix domain-containing protein n=1 Tax=Nonomuraea purpurea TaxID=1849276 RepID=A0ABV8GEA1_9ACTN
MPQTKPTTPGQRIRGLRLRRGYKQAELAELAGVSVDLVSALERDVRKGMSWASMVKLARALDVDPGVIAGKGSYLEPVPGAAALAVRDAVINPGLLPKMSPEGGQEQPDTAELWRRVESGYGAYFGGEFGVLAADLPDLIHRCRVLHSAERAAGAAVLAHAWQLAACVLVHTGRDDAAAIAAERAISVGQTGDDPYRLATMYGTYSWVMLHQGRLAEAEEIAIRTAEEIEPTMSRAVPNQLTAWGGLVLNAAVACGARGDRAQAEEYLSVARAGAARVGADRHDYWVSFGPSHVGVQTTHIMTALNRPDVALKASGTVRREDLLPVQWGRHRLNDARALLELHKSDAAEEAAAEAKAVSAEWFRHQGFARSVVDDLVDHRQRLSASLRDLVSVFEG